MKFRRVFIPVTILCLSVLSVVGALAGADRDMPQFIPTDPPSPAPDVAVTTRDGESVRLSDLRGRPVLLNLWATWCAPCVAEMPALEALAIARAGTPLEIMAVAEDRRGEAAVGPFVAQHRLQTLRIYLDPKSTVSHAFGIDAIPTTILIDREGRVVGRLAGAAEWDGPAARRLIDRVLAPRAPETFSTQR